MARTIADLMADTLRVCGVKRIYGVVGDSLNGFTGTPVAGPSCR
jgi:pyruvate dehydrogenase (quinone)